MKRVALGFLAFSLFASASSIEVPTAFKTSFRQKITNPDKKVIEYRGKLLLNSTGDLKWSYTSPTKKEVCSSNQNFVVVDHDLEQVSFYTLDKSLDLPEILRNARPQKAAGSNAADYTNKLYVANIDGKNYTIGLDSRGRIDQIAYKDDMDNIVNIHFENMKYLSKSYSGSKMECKYPSSYDTMSQ